MPDVPGVPAAVLATAVAGALTALAADQPTLLVLDDLQWSAPETLVVLRRAVREVAPGSALLVLALARDDGTHPAGPLAGALGPLAGEGLLTRVRLGGLTEAEGRELAAATGSVRAADARRLTSEAAGNPFLLTHLLAAADAGRAAGPADGTRLPDAVGGWVADRLAEAGPDAAALVRAGALGGPGFELDLASAVAGLDATAGLDAADAAVAAHLLVEERGGPPGRFRFVHPVVRRAVVEGLAPTRRQALHRRTAAVLAEHRRDSPDHLAAAATHALDGAPPGPDAEAVARALAAAGQALADGDPVTAVNLLTRAHPHLPEHDSALTAQLLVTRGQASLAVADLRGHARRRGRRPPRRGRHPRPRRPPRRPRRRGRPHPGRHRSSRPRRPRRPVADRAAGAGPRGPGAGDARPRQPRARPPAGPPGRAGPHAVGHAPTRCHRRGEAGAGRARRARCARRA